MKNIVRIVAKAVGVVLVFVVVLFAVGVLWPLDRPQPGMQHDRLVITGAVVVDTETGRLHEGHSVLIEDGIIKAVADGIETDGAVVLDARGLYAIPGMFDMHAHTLKMAPELMHPLFVASGVTAIRDMGGCIGIEDAWVACADDKRAWNDAVLRGRMVAPRYDQVTSLAINGGSEIPDSVDKALGGETADGARARVSYDKARQIDFLKTYTQLPRAGFFALAEEARAQDMYLAGHLPFGVAASEAVDAGQRSFEHALLFVWDCYPGMAELREKGDLFAAFTNDVRAKMISDHDASHCDHLFAKMAAAGTAFVPTHTTRKLDAFALDPIFRNDGRLKYIPGPLRMLWLDDADGMAARAGAGGEESYRAVYEFGIELTGRAHRAGVDVMLGTDAPDSFAFPGAGIHDEFAHLTQAGLTPLEALQAATTVPARFLGLAGQAGVIKPGARADIILLRDNPLEDIQAVRQVDSVVLAGAIYDRSDLDAMLRAVEANAGSWSMWPKFAWQVARSPIMLKQFAD
ncbi:amidohydrolase family protein [Kordiimonas aestuarii]|uniref:amidohydrolase family protein n=1 Tax=Kordiimonas aestuarii TaxID=1005925 RepID=UPI0021D128D6|nr:amidohydrolase family protein [Kordiimonas aestuarii]